MGAIKDFIKENSPPSLDTPQPKKKRRVRLKNFNPFRKRKYKVLNENNSDSDQYQPRDTNPSLVDDQNNSFGSGTSSSRPKNTKNNSQKRPRPGELLQAAWESLGLAKGNLDDPDSGKRKKAHRRRHGAYECLIEEEIPVEIATDAPGEAVQNVTGLACETADGGPRRSGKKSGSEVKRVTISDDIEIIETVEQAPPQKKKKKSTKKKIKKAGIKTAKFLGDGLANMAVTLQYVTPEAAMIPAAKEIYRRREESYRKRYTTAAC